MKEQPNVVLHVVEQAFGQRPFEVTCKDNPNDLQLRSYDELWHKENMINLGIQRLPEDWEYVAWIDADIEFQHKDWATRTLHGLQHYQILQMFSQAIDLGPNGEAFQMHNGFIYSYLTGKDRPKHGYSNWHPGYAWAARREAIDHLGGLYDVSICGSGDHLMAWALLGEGVDRLPSQMSEGYRESLRDWEQRATRYIHRDIGYIPGTILHLWHGRKRNRFYNSRWKILADSQFDPEFDIKKDWQGLYQFDMDGSHRLIKLRDDLRAYLRSRNEDSIDME